MSVLTDIAIKEQDLIQEKQTTLEGQGLEIPTNVEFGKMDPMQRSYNYSALKAYAESNPKLNIVLPNYPEYLKRYDAQMVSDQITSDMGQKKADEIAGYNESIRLLEADINATKTERQETTTYALKWTGEKEKGEKVFKEYPKTSFIDVDVPLFEEGSLPRQQKEQQLFRLYTERDAITGYEAIVDNAGGRMPINPTTEEAISEEQYIQDYDTMVGIGNILSDVKQMKAEFAKVYDQTAGSTDTQAMIKMKSPLLNNTQYRGRLKNFLAQYNMPDGTNEYIDLTNRLSYLIDQYGEEYFINMSNLKNRAGY